MTTLLKVLIVEDDRAMAEMCARLIRRHGHSAVIAESGPDALAIIQSTSDVTAVLTDVQMPHMTGRELLIQLRNLDAEMPVIVMTGYANLLNPIEARSLGASDYLSKPFDAETLIDSLERACSASQPVSDIPEHV